MKPPSISFFFFCLLLVGCGKLDEQGFNGAKLRGEAKEGAVIEIGNYTPFVWDRLHIFVSSSSREMIAEELGKRVPFPHLDNGTACLLVFTSDDKISAAFEEPRNFVDFNELYQKGGYGRAEARFKVVIGDDASVILKKE